MLQSIKSAVAGMLPTKKTPSGVPESPDKKNAAPIAPGEAKAVTLLAWSTPGVNPRLLVAYQPGTDPTNPSNLVSVRVANNKNFIKHMELKASHVKNGLYELIGAPPRWKGRW